MLLWLCWRWASWPVLTLGVIGGAVAATVAGFVVGKTIARIAWFREALIRVGLGIVMSLLGWLAARAYLYLFDKWYLRLGRLDRVVSRDALALCPQPVVLPGTIPPAP